MQGGITTEEPCTMSDPLLFIYQRRKMILKQLPVDKELKSCIQHEFETESEFKKKQNKTEEYIKI